MDERVGKLGDLLTLLVKAALVTDDAESLTLRRSALSVRQDLLKLRPDESLKSDGAWTRAVREAEAPEMQPRQGRVSFSLPARCPLAIADLIEPGFDVDRIVNRIAESASTG